MSGGERTSRGGGQREQRGRGRGYRGDEGRKKEDNKKWKPNLLSLLPRGTSIEADP
jgi:hypothetical protein